MRRAQDVRILPSRGWAAALLLLAWAAAGPSFGQSLGEVAQKEKARRERGKKPSAAKVFTDEDLSKPETPKGEGSTAESTAPAVPTSGEAGSSSSEGSPSSRGEPGGDSGGAQGSGDEQGWRSRAAAARATVLAAEREAAAADAEVERLKQDLNPMSTTFNTDPYVILRLQGQLTEAENRAASVRQTVTEAKNAFAALEEEARRAGVPLAWLREIRE